MGQELKEFLTQKSTVKKPEEKAPSEKGKNKPPGRSITLSDGKVIELDDLGRYDKQANQWLNLKRIKQRYPPIKYPPAIPLELPEYLKPREDPDKGLTEKQREYKKNLLSKRDLEEQAPKVIKSNNPLGLRRYLFINEVIACKNGFIYYTAPLILSVIFLAINLFQYAFLPNIFLSIFALVNILLVKKTIKRDRSAILKALTFVLLFAIDFGVLYLTTLISGFWEQVYVLYALKLLLIIFGIYHFGKFYAFFLLVYHGDCTLDFGNVVQVNAGKPRSGKTSSGVHDVFALALLKWKELQYDYWLYVSREDEILKSGTADDKLMLKEVKLAYEFYIKSPCVPCLWSNIGIFDKKGRASHKVTLEHIKGLNRLPLYSVVFFDELGATLKADDGLNRSGVEKPLDVSDMFRLGGHFLKWCVIGSEQDFNHIFIDCRRVVGFNKVILGQEWVCRPTLLYGLFKFLKWDLQCRLDKKIKKRKRYARFMDNLESFCKGIGFRRVRYKYAGNTETGANVVGATGDSTLSVFERNKVRYMPSRLIADYDDRAYKQLYPSYYDRRIVGELHSSKCINGKDVNSLTFVSKTSALTEKRDVVLKGEKL